MKITKISLQNFRAFDESFELDLDGGKNLLLHGENGSGKSSIYFALKRFFEERGDDIARHRNYFAPETRTPYVHVHLKGKDAAGQNHDEEFRWDVADGHPLPVPKDPTTAPISNDLRSLLVDASRRAGFLDYRTTAPDPPAFDRALALEPWPTIHDTIYGIETRGLESQLFRSVSLVILAGVRVSTAGGGETTIGVLMREVWENRPYVHYKK